MMMKVTILHHLIIEVMKKKKEHLVKKTKNSFKHLVKVMKELKKMLSMNLLRM